MRALLRVDVGDDHLARDRGRRDVHGAAADSAGADDHQMVVGADMAARLLQGRVGRDAGAGVGRGEVLRHALIGQEIAPVRHDDMRAIAAGDPGAEGARPQAQQFLALLAHRALAAADPGIGNHLVADFDARGSRAERSDLAGDLMPHRERQMHATGFERELLAVAEIEMPVPDVDVAVADARRLDPQ